MPNYEYECESCGPFVENRPMAEFDRPFQCPDCNELAPRLLTCPALGGGAMENGGAMPAQAAHSGGCACCAGPRSWSAEAV